MDKDLLMLIIELVITIAAFVVGRYVLPKNKTNIQNVASQFKVLLDHAESFCAYARQFLDCSGTEKMDTVVEKLKGVCKKHGIEIDEETLRAIGQKAYDAMIAGQNSSKVIVETVALEELKTAPVIEGTIENTVESSEDGESIN